MTATLNELLDQEPALWISSLPEYQVAILKSLEKEIADPREQAVAWLSASPGNTFPFGSVRGPRPFLEKLEDEVFGYLCDDPKYESDRQKLFSEIKPAHAYVVGAISASIAPYLGSTATFLAPAVALVLFSLGKCTLNAVCSHQKERRVLRQNQTV